MLDIHCHILPGIDDGARTTTESLKLARAAVNNGITHAICTPHIHFGRYNNSAENIQASLTSLKSLLSEHQINLSVAAAAEVRFDVEILGAIERRNIPFLGKWEGHSVLLLELPTGEFPLGAENLVHLLRDQEITVMIAHPERNKGILREPKLLKKLTNSGCLIQITAASLTGGFGANIQELAYRMVKEDIADVIASDAHHHNKRPPLLNEAYNITCSLRDANIARKLTHDVPWKICESHFRTQL